MLQTLYNFSHKNEFLSQKINDLKTIPEIKLNFLRKRVQQYFNNRFLNWTYFLIKYIEFLIFRCNIISFKIYTKTCTKIIKN